MPYEERVKIYADALRVFGAESQMVVAVEEMSEVQKEICKLLRGGNDMRALAEEVADATIMLEQIRLMFLIDGEVKRIMDAKMERLKQRIAAEAYAVPE